jgi:hypothetical protein
VAAEKNQKNTIISMETKRKRSQRSKQYAENHIFLLVQDEEKCDLNFTTQRTIAPST